MLTSDLFASVRFLLHDNDRVSDTGQHFFSDESIGKALTESVAVLARELITPLPDPRTFQLVPRSAHLTVAPLAKSYTPVWAGASPDDHAPLPDDFFILECGSMAGRYVPALRASLGGTIAGLSISKLFASAGNLFGPHADTVYYFAIPPKLDASASGPLPLLSDGFYNAAKYAACRDLMTQHAKSGFQRSLFFSKVYAEAKATLR